MSVLARLRLYRALSGLTVDCVSSFTQGVALGSYLPRLLALHPDYVVP